MNSRERVRTTIRHQTPDKLPVDCGGAPVTSMHCTCVEALRDYYGLEKKPVTVHEPFQMLGQIDEDLVEILGIDTIGISPRTNLFGVPNGNWREWRTPWGQEVLISGYLEMEQGEAGDVYVYPQGDRSARPSGHMPASGYYFDLIDRSSGKLRHNVDDPANQVEEFGELTDEDLAHFQAQIDAALPTERAIVANLGIVPFVDIGLIQGPTLKEPKGIRNMTDWLMATIKYQDYLHEVFDRQSDIAVANLKKAHAAVGENIDVLYLCGYDFGTQNSTFCSADTFQSLFAPYYRKVTGWVHDNTTWQIFKHTDGAIEPFMSLFADVGIDILNPIQWTATNMDPQHLKGTYNNRLAFWGAGIDTQKTMPYGTAEQVREEALRMCEIFGAGGGYIYNSVHNLLPGSPVENLVAFFNAPKEYNGEPIATP